jgi:hypothetical protein
MRNELNMNIKTFVTSLGFAGFLGAAVSPELPKNMRQWLLEMHAAQIELLKIDWGQPGFCTEWDRDFDRRTHSCGGRGKTLRRRYPKQ